MAKVTRQRGTYQGQVVTIIKRGKTKTTIRDRFGFVKDVSNRQVKRLGESDDRASFTYGEGENET